MTSSTDILAQIQNKFLTSVHGGLSTNILPTFLATSVDIEQVFSQGCIILSHLWSWLSVQTIRALMCVREWSCMGYVKGSDFKMAVLLPEVPTNEKESGLVNGWDSIVI